MRKLSMEQIITDAFMEYGGIGDKPKAMVLRCAIDDMKSAWSRAAESCTELQYDLTAAQARIAELIEADAHTTEQWKRDNADNAEGIARRDARIAELESKLRAATTWDGSDRRCEHQMKWIADWYGDPSIPNGTADCSRLECEQCGWIDPNGEKPERDYGI